MHFEILGEISHAETFAVGSSIREVARLRKLYGKGRWRKRKGIARVRLREPLIKSEVPAVQGRTAIFQTRKCLKNEEKQKPRFCFSCSEKSRMDLFRASLETGTLISLRFTGTKHRVSEGKSSRSNGSLKGSENA